MAKHAPSLRSEREYIEQAYLFRAACAQPPDAQEQATQEPPLAHRSGNPLDDPLALRHPIPRRGDETFGPAGVRLRADCSHYFTPYQAFIIGAAEQENRRFSLDTAFLVLPARGRVSRQRPDAAGFVSSISLKCLVPQSSRLRRWPQKSMADDVLPTSDAWSSFPGDGPRPLGLMDLRRHDLSALGDCSWSDQRRLNADYVVLLAAHVRREGGQDRQG